MDGIKQKIAQNKAALIIVAGTVVLVIILGIFLGKGALNEADNQFAGVAGSFSEDGADVSVDDMKISAQGIDGVYSPKITYPVFSNPDMFDYSGEHDSCGSEIVWVRTEIPQPQFVWRATLEAASNPKYDLGYLPGSPLAFQKQVTLEKAIIVDDTAKAYFTGEFEFDKGDKCAKERLVTQIEEAGLQFGNVHSVEVYLNGELFN